MRTRVYIAGPISRGDRVDNLAQAVKAYRELIQHGYAPLCPQLSALVAFLIHPDEADWLKSHAVWLDVDLSWVLQADAVLRLPGYSAGADQETRFAREQRIPVYLSLDDLYRKLPSCTQP